ncbi:hypothetical protein GCM10009733_006570 [Nonomuraea maheshkhaliensis]|uniref:Asp/Glu racemase n=1 Tax=Nonomuraea maheshkhaliensis TaxID=419590 RepID=A0ABP4QKU0_9ACTN
MALQQVPDHHRPLSHAGVLVPWANTVVEAELRGWGRGLTVWHYARLVPACGGTALDDDFLSGLIEAVPQALHQLSQIPLHRVYLACTSAAFTRPGRFADVTAASPVLVVSAFEAIVAQLRRHGVRKVALVTPYPDAVTKAEAVQFAETGITVTGSTSLGLADGYCGVTLAQQMALADQLGNRTQPNDTHFGLIRRCLNPPASAVFNASNTGAVHRHGSGRTTHSRQSRHRRLYRSRPPDHRRSPALSVPARRGCAVAMSQVVVELVEGVRAKPVLLYLPRSGLYRPAAFTL